jgi:deazaflavin-dependent oxidoreductase (nitroreductase family)
LLGHRLRYLIHRGRKTGKHRETILEVVGYDPHTPEVFVVAGWGERGDWYRNLVAAPAIEVRVGRHRQDRRGRLSVTAVMDSRTALPVAQAAPTAVPSGTGSGPLPPPLASQKEM